MPKPVYVLLLVGLGIAAVGTALVTVFNPHNWVLLSASGPILALLAVASAVVMHKSFPKT